MDAKDSETGVFIPPTTVYISTVSPTDSGRRNGDGLKIPDSSRAFNFMVMFYKIILSLQSILLVSAAVVLVFAFTRPDDEEVMEIFDRLIMAVNPLTAVMNLAYDRRDGAHLPLIVGLVENVIGWTGILTLRMRFLMIDFGFKCFWWGVCVLVFVLGIHWIKVLGLMFETAIPTAILYIIMRDIRRENAPMTQVP